MTDPLLVMAGSYVAELGRAAQRARDADLLVAVDLRGAVLGTVTVDWYPAPDLLLLAFGRTREWRSVS